MCVLRLDLLIDFAGALQPCPSLLGCAHLISVRFLSLRHPTVCVCIQNDALLHAVWHHYTPLHLVLALNSILCACVHILYIASYSCTHDSHCASVYTPHSIAASCIRNQSLAMFCHSPTSVPLHSSLCPVFLPILRIVSPRYTPARTLCLPYPPFLMTVHAFLLSLASCISPFQCVFLDERNQPHALWCAYHTDH